MEATLSDKPRDADGRDYCLDTLRDSDRDRYLACLLSPKEKRGDLAALYAFNAEIARIRDLVRDPLPGEIRLQWWRDLVDGEARGDSLANPLAAGLISTIETNALPRKAFANMLEARVFDLYDDPLESRTALEGYAGETASMLIQLAALVLSPETAPSVAEVSGHAGVAQAMAGMLLLMPLHRSRGQVYIPLDMLSAVGLDRDSFLAGKDHARIDAAIQIFAGLALEHLEKARATKVAATVFPAFLPVALAGPVIESARKIGAGIFERNIQPSRLRKQWWLMKATFAGKI